MPKILIDVPEGAYEAMKRMQGLGYYQKLILDGTPLTDLTNGEVLIKMFPKVRVLKWRDSVTVLGENNEFNNSYPLDWWNAKWGE